ncbi:MAG: cytochrome-c peroxidase [Gammaproteobacteria bacterium]
MFGLLALSVVLLAGCGKSETPEPAPKAEAPKAASLQRAKALFDVLPERMEADGREITDAKVALGRVLYSDPRFSKNHDVACATCHALDHFGVDPRPEAIEKGTSPGHGNQFGGRNSPTSFNAGLQIAQFWDGRAADLEEQAKGPVLNPVEMAMPDATTVVTVIKTIPGYAPMFADAFPGEADPITYENMAAAIGAFERLLVTPGPFDTFLSGDSDALSAEAQQGMVQFLDSGCASCHMGPALGGTMYQKLGLVQAYETQDTGRFEATGNEADKYFFKVPTLRNIAETGPYFHNGSIKTLDDAIRVMAKHQTPGGELSGAEVASIEAFLESLTGVPPAELVAAPTLPESGPDTPAPDPR